jgi:hypothetical protein
MKNPPNFNGLLHRSGLEVSQAASYVRAETGASRWEGYDKNQRMRYASAPRNWTAAIYL